MIQVNNLCKTFGGGKKSFLSSLNKSKEPSSVIALDGLSFTANDGEITGILGPNGAGKTTCLRTLYGLLNADEGNAIIDGINVVENPLAARAKLGIFPDKFGLYERLTAYEQIDYFASIHGLQGDAKHLAIDDLEWVKQFIVAIRNIRGEMDISPSKSLPVLLKNVNENDQRRLTENKQFLSALAKLETITVLDDSEQAPASASAVVGDLSVLIPMAGLIDKAAELARLDKAIEKLEKDAARTRGKLGNENFVGKAPAAVIDKEKAKLAEAESTLAKMLEQKKQIAAL